MIKRLFLILIAMLIFCSISFGRAKYQGIAEKGGKAVKTNTTTIYSLVETFPNCTITVYLTGTTTLASIYTNITGTIKANPFTAASDASFFFYVDNGRYDIKFSGTGITSPFTKSDISITDPSDSSFKILSFGAKCDGSTNDAVAIQAAINAALANGNGNIEIPGKTCKFSAQLILGNTTGGGDGNGAFSGVSLIGTNGLVGSTLSWAGATNIPAIKIVRGRFNNIKNLLITNAGIKGTTVGVQITGPVPGGQSFWQDLESVTINGFHINLEVGDLGTQHDADIIHIKNTVLQFGDIGIQWSGFNSTYGSFYGVNLESNATYGLYIANGFPIISWHGGAWGRNGISINTAAVNGQYTFEGIRDELPANAANWKFYSGAGSLYIETCDFAGEPSTPTTKPLINNTGQTKIFNTNFIYAAAHFIPFGSESTSASSQVDGTSRLIMEHNRVNENVPLFQYASDNSQPQGFHYTLKYNQKYNDAGNVTGYFPDEDGYVSWPNKKSNIELGTSTAYASLTPAQITTNQDNYSPTQGNYQSQGTTYLRLSTDASRNITGLVFQDANLPFGTTVVTPSDGQTIFIINVGAQNIVLKNETTSTAAYRFHNTTGADITLAADQQVMLVYDATISRWRVSKMN